MKKKIKFQKKVRKVMGEFGEETLHSGKRGPVVTNPKQAIAIALSEARRATGMPKYNPKKQNQITRALKNKFKNA